MAYMQDIMRSYIRTRFPAYGVPQVACFSVYIPMERHPGLKWFYAGDVFWCRDRETFQK